MRIGLHCHRLDRTGAPLMLFRLARALVARHQVELLLPRDPDHRGPLVAEYQAIGVPCRESMGLRGYDVFIANTLMSASLVVDGAAHVPMLYWVHEPASGLAFLRDGRSDPRALALADRVVFPTRWQAEVPFAPWLAGVRWQVVPYGIGIDTTPRPCPFEKIPGRFTLVQVGMISQRKGQDITLFALRQLADPTIDLYLLGSREAAPEVTAQLERGLARLPELARRVHFTGSVDEATVNAYLQHCDAVVFPTRDDLITLAILEAMLFGRCVISSDFGPIPETIRHDIDGLLFPVDDGPACAAAIARARRDPALVERLGQAARARYHEKHAFEVHVAAMEAVLEEIRRR